MIEPPRLFASFAGDEMLRESGRLPFAVLWPFVRSGYEVSVQRGLRQRLETFYADRHGGLPETARLSLSIPGVTYDAEPPPNPASSTLVSDGTNRATSALGWQRRLHIRFDLFSPYRLRAPLIAPYAMHPSQALAATDPVLRGLRATPRRIRLLFAGDSKGYVRNRVRYPGPKLPRAEVLSCLRSGLADALTEVQAPDDMERLIQGEPTCRFVLSDSGSGVHPRRWLPTLAAADFFLCPPGIVMPMCHNVVEAMAVGAIPLIGYPEWFHPRLEHMRNCIVFDGAGDLVDKARQVLQMPQLDIERMRAAVIEHYETHLRPERLVQAVQATPGRDTDILLYTELNMARNESRLGPRSVLMRGPDADGSWRWLGRLIDRRGARRT